MELKRGYKNSDAGVLPESWDASTVGKEFTVQLGKMLDEARNVGVPKPYLGNRAVQWGRIDVGELAHVRLTPSDLQKFRLEHGDLLVCEGGEVGRAAIWEGQLPECYYQKALHRLRSTRGYHPFLMRCLLERWQWNGTLRNYVTQTSIAHLPKDKFETVPLPVPPLAEQRAIAEALGDVDALLASLDKLLAKKRDLKQAAMQQLLTGRTRLPGFRKPWELTTLGDLLEFRNGVNAEKRAYGRGVPFINVLEVITKPHLSAGDIPGRVSLPLNLIDAYAVRRGDIVFNRTSETQEEVALASVYMDAAAVVFGGFVIRGRPSSSRLDVTYSGYALRAPDVRQQLIAKGQGAIRANVGQSEMRTVRIRLPELDEQKEIAAVLWDMDAEIAALGNRRDKTRAIKQGMMQELLTGRTRLA